MKICSLLPSGTEIVFALGLGDQLAGVTDLCDYPDEARTKPALSRSLIDSDRLSSAEVEAEMQACMRDGRSPFSLDAARLQRERPDVVLTQDTCYRCDVDAAEVQHVLRAVHPQPNILVLAPKTIGEIFQTIIDVGTATGVPQVADALVFTLEQRVAAVSSRAADARSRPRVASLEGINPLVAGGHWLPELKELAGGRDGLFTPGCGASRLSWETMTDYNPEVLVITPCSSDLERSRREIEILAGSEGWWNLAAVRSGEVYIVDHVYFSRPGPRIVRGLEILAQIIHPELFSGLVAPGAALKLSPRPGASRPPELLADWFTPYP